MICEVQSAIRELQISKVAKWNVRSRSAKRDSRNVICEVQSAIRELHISKVEKWNVRSAKRESRNVICEVLNRKVGTVNCKFRKLRNEREAEV